MKKVCLQWFILELHPIMSICKKDANNNSNLWVESTVHWIGLDISVLKTVWLLRTTKCWVTVLQTVIWSTTFPQPILSPLDAKLATRTHFCLFPNFCSKKKVPQAFCWYRIITVNISTTLLPTYCFQRLRFHLTLRTRDFKGSNSEVPYKSIIPKSFC